MIIETFKPYIEKMVRSEPWRAIADEKRALCTGSLDWDGSAFWHCKICGRIGYHSLPSHYPPTKQKPVY